MLDLDPPKLVDTLSLPSEDWMAKPKVDELHAMLPIDSIVSVYDELSQPPFPVSNYPNSLIRALRFTSKKANA